MAKRDYYETLGISKTAKADANKRLLDQRLENSIQTKLGSSAAEEDFKAVRLQIFLKTLIRAAYDQYGVMLRLKIRCFVILEEEDFRQLSQMYLKIFLGILWGFFTKRIYLLFKKRIDLGII